VKKILIYNIVNNRIYLLLSLVVIILFVIYKIPFLNFPFYWDEAWVYGPSVRLMAENVPSLLPDALPIDYSRGHPLFFHFFGALWAKVFGSSLISLHSFALTVSVFLLVVSFKFAKEFFSEKIAFITVLTLSLQPIFLAQSVLVLPEVMLALFSLLTIYYYLKKKFIWYFIFGTALIMTKESGVVVFCALSLFSFLINIKKLKLKYLIVDILKILSPLVVIFIYLYIQYSMYGWFFFPGHIDFITTDLSAVWNKLTDGYGAYLAIYQGRNLLFFSSVLIFIYLLIRKKKLEYKNMLLLFLIFIIGFLMFSSLNFFSNRYIMCIILPFILLTVGIIFQGLKNKYIMIVFLIVFTGLQYREINKKTNSDHNLGYINAVKVHQSMINYCTDKELQNKYFYSYFMTRVIMTNHLSGYVEKGEEFIHVGKDYTDKTEYCIFSNFDSDKEHLLLRNNSELKLIKRYEIEQAWIELYENTKQN